MFPLDVVVSNEKLWTAALVVFIACGLVWLIRNLIGR